MHTLKKCAIADVVWGVATGGCSACGYDERIAKSVAQQAGAKRRPLIVKKWRNRSEQNRLRDCASLCLMEKKLCNKLGLCVRAVVAIDFR
jgi:hypothetical protein